MTSATKKEWFTLSELAALKLPRFASTLAGLQKLAARERWRAAVDVAGKPLSRARSGRGAGVEFHVSLLPPHAMAAIVDPKVPVVDELVPDLEVSGSKAVAVRDARLIVLGLAKTWRRDNGYTNQNEAWADFAERYNNGEVSVEAAIRRYVPNVCLRTLHNWNSALSKGDARRLSSRRGRRAGSTVIDVANGGEARLLTQAMIVKSEFLTARHIRDYAVSKFGDSLVKPDGEVVPVPSERSVRRYKRAWESKNKVALTKIRNPDKFRSHYRIAGKTRHAHVERLNQTWQIDASPVDVLCIEGRYSIYMLIDVWSRRAMLWATKTPRASAVNLLLRRAILEWGVPEVVETDNGSDFKSKAVSTFLSATGIAHHKCDPHQPQQKGIVERVIGTFQRDFGPLMPGFIGHSVKDRKAIESRRSFAERLGCSDEKAFCIDLSADELQGYFDQWASGRYAHRAHRALGKNVTPFLKVSQWTGKIRRIESERALDVLLMDLAGQNGIRTVGKQGLRMDGGHWITSNLIVGEKVLVRLDPHDLGKAYMFSTDGSEFLGTAINPETYGLNRGAAVAMARAEQTRMIDEATKDARVAARKIKPRDMAGALLAQAAAKTAATAVHFPRPSEHHATPLIDAARVAAMDAPTEPAPAPRKLTPEQQAQVEAYRAEMERREAARGAPSAPERKKHGMPLDEADNWLAYYRWRNLHTAQGRGEPLSEDDAHWVTYFQTSPEWKVRESFLEHYGLHLVDWRIFYAHEARGIVCTDPVIIEAGATTPRIKGFEGND